MKWRMQALALVLTTDTDDTQGNDLQPDKMSPLYSMMLIL